MFVRLFIPLLIVVYLLIGGASSQAQVDRLVFREEDERAATIEQRETLLADLQAKAQQYRREGNLIQAAGLLNRVAWLQTRLFKQDKALATFNEVLTMLKHEHGSPAEIDSLNGAAAIHAEASRCEDAQKALTKALRLSKQSHYVAGRAEALRVQSDCQNHSDTALALKTAQESLALWQSIDSKWGIAKTYLVIGDSQLSQNDLIAATQSYEASLKLRTELNIPAERAEAIINLAWVEYRRGAWQNNLSMLSHAQSLIDEKAEAFKMGQIAAGSAETFIEVGMPETALEKLKLATEYFRQANSSRAQVVIYWNMGRAHYLLGDYQQALANLKAGLASGISLEEPGIAALCAEHLGRTYGALNELDSALENYQWALDQYRKVSKPMEAARTIALIGELYQRQGKVDQARTNYGTALGVFRELSDHLNESATLYALGSLELQQNKVDVAEDHLRQSLQVTENIRRVSTSNDLTVAFSATVQERYEGLIECLMRKHQREPSRGFNIEAFEISELARGRSLTEFLHATQTNLTSGIEPELAEKEKSIRQELRVKEDALFASNYKPEELAELKEKITRLQAEYKQVDATIRSRYPAYDQITNATVSDLRQIQRQVIIDHQTLLLEYVLGPKRSYVWAVTSTSLSSHELPPEEQITTATKKVYDLIKEAPNPSTTIRLAKASDELAKMILAPASAELAKMISAPVAEGLNQHRRIIVVADGALNYAPFQILPAPPANGAPLISNFVIVNAPSASILGQLQLEAGRRRSPGNVLALFGDPVFASNYPQFGNASQNEQIATRGPENYQGPSTSRDIEPDADSTDPSKLQPLFYARRELANLRNVAGEQTFVATGFDASREKLNSTDLSGYAIVHFATHGILDPNKPQKSGLFLSTVARDGHAVNGFVGLDDVYQLRAPVNLVVLSACRTGLGKDVRGEGLIGLTRGFMYAGASSVVASLWKVDDEATSELMKRFYFNMLKQGMRPAVALQAAQNSIRAEPQWSSPYYWAAFTLQGDYRGEINPSRATAESNRMVIITGIVLLTLLVGLYVSYRRMLVSLGTNAYSRVKR